VALELSGAVAHREGMPMASGGGSVLARGEEAAAFIAGRKAVRDASLRAKATTLQCGPRHSRSTTEGGGDIRTAVGQ
jgi:hypothetical protein